MTKRHLNFERLEPRLLFAAGEVDPTFGRHGVVSESWEQYGRSSDSVVESQLDSAGRLIVVGNTTNGHGWVGTLMRCRGSCPRGRRGTVDDLCLRSGQPTLVRDRWLESHDGLHL